ncbi:unnamed protein product, partial [Laminaria digitata]
HESRSASSRGGGGDGGGTGGAGNNDGSAVSSSAPLPLKKGRGLPDHWPAVVGPFVPSQQPPLSTAMALSTILKTAKARGSWWSEPGRGQGLGRGRGDDAVVAVGRESLSRREGFRNMGNTCYVNACLQGLLSLRGFITDIQTECWVLAMLKATENPAGDGVGGASNPDVGAADAAAASAGMFARGCWGGGKGAGGAAAGGKGPGLYDALLRLSLEARGSHGLMDATPLKKAMDRESHRFAGNMQQDAHEFLGNLINVLHEEARPRLEDAAAYLRKAEAENAPEIVSPLTCGECVVVVDGDGGGAAAAGKKRRRRDGVSGGAGAGDGGGGSGSGSDGSGRGGGGGGGENDGGVVDLSSDGRGEGGGVGEGDGATIVSAATAARRKRSGGGSSGSSGRPGREEENAVLRATPLNSSLFSFFPPSSSSSSSPRPPPVARGLSEAAPNRRAENRQNEGERGRKGEGGQKAEGAVGRGERRLMPTTRHFHAEVEV